MENNTVNVMKASGAADFEHRNIVQLCGKIVNKKRVKRDELRFTISCGRGKKERKDKDGKVLRDIIRVTFFDDAAEAYDKRFETGDFVTVNGITQTVRDHYNATSSVTVWGISMGPKYIRGRVIPDHNRVHIRGKIDSAAVISRNYIILNVLTVVDKDRRYLGQSDEISTISNKYRSVTPVGIRCNDDAYKVIKSYTEGTYVDVSGFVDTRSIKIDDEHTKLVNRVLGTKIFVVGDIQPVNK